MSSSLLRESYFGSDLLPPLNHTGGNMRTALRMALLLLAALLLSVLPLFADEPAWHDSTRDALTGSP